MVAVRETAARLLQRQSERGRLPPVLIQGETGVGKGLLARALHRAGPRASGPFVDVNCAAIPETLLEAELFGYERGAFTDARHAKAGLFQTANHGTIFLDEVGLLPEALQAKLLKALEDRAVRRLGSTRTEPVDVWIVTASNEDLASAARARRFREDLYHRLAVVTLTIPPLRDRGEDVLLLAAHFLGRACAEYRLPSRSLTPDARAALLAYPWPGNVRELANVMERVALLSEAPVVTAELLGLPTVPAAPAPTDARAEPKAPESPALADGAGQRGAGASRRGPAPDRGQRHAGGRAARNLPGHPPVPHGEARPGTRGAGPTRTEPHDPARPARPARRPGPARGGRASRARADGRHGRGHRAAGGPMGGPAARVPAERARPAGRRRSRVQSEPRARDPGREDPDVRRTDRGDEPDGHRRGVRAGADRGRPATGRAGGDGGAQGRGAGQRRRGGRHPGPLGNRRPAGARRVLPRRSPGRPGWQA